MTTGKPVVCLLVFTLGFALALSSCASSPEAKAARFIENGKKQLNKKDAGRAILEFQNAVKVTPGNAEAYYQLARGFLAAGDGAHAGVALRRTLEIDPKHHGAELLIAKLMASTNDKEFVADAQKRLQALLQESPGDADELYALALTELKLNDASGAVRDLDLARAAAPQAIMISARLAQAKLQQRDAKGAEEVLKKAVENSPKSADAVVILGRFYLGLKRLPDAEQQFTRALTMNPNDTGALFNLGLVQDELGKKQEAEGTFRKLSRMPGKEYRATLAAFFSQEGRKDEALQELVRLNKEDPDDRRVRTLLIAAYVAADRTPDAEKLLNSLLKKNPKDLDALLQRGELALSAGNFNQAEVDLNQVVHLQPASAQLHYVLAKLYRARKEDLRYRQELAKALELDPTLLGVRLELAGVLIASNGKQGAQAALDILNAAPSFQKNVPALLAQRNWVLWDSGNVSEMRKGIDQGLAMVRSTEFLLQDGQWKLRSGDSAGARKSFEEALKIDPADLRALGGLERSYGAQKQTPAFLQKVKEYAAQQPKSAALQEYLGFHLMTQDRAGARAALNAALAADPKFVSPQFLLAQLDFADGKLDDAAARMQKVAAADGHNAAAHLWLGKIEDRQGNHAAAQQEFQKAVDQDPGNAESMNNLAYLLAEYRGQTDEALKYAQKAEELSPDNADYADTIGWVLYKKGLYSAAAVQLERAASRGANAISKYHLAMAYAKAGQVDRAQVALNAALKENPNLPEARVAKEMLGAPANPARQ